MRQNTHFMLDQTHDLIYCLIKHTCVLQASSCASHRQALVPLYPFQVTCLGLAVQEERRQTGTISYQTWDCLASIERRAHIIHTPYSPSHKVHDTEEGIEFYKSGKIVRSPTRLISSEFCPRIHASPAGCTTCHNFMSRCAVR